MAIEWVTKLIDLLKLPLRYVWVVVLAASFMLFAPESWIKALSLNALKQNFSPYIGVVFILCSAIVLINIAEWISKKSKNMFERRRFFNDLILEIADLDSKEKAILREFYIQDQDTIKLPVDQQNVAGLLKKRILTTVGSMGERSLAGSLFPVTIKKEVKPFITIDLIDLPEEPNDSQIEWLREQRPDFLYEVERHNEIFHKTSFRRRRLL